MKRGGKKAPRKIRTEKTNNGDAPPPDYANSYDNLTKDLLSTGNDESGSDDDDDFPSTEHEHDDEEEKPPDYMLFDFRRGRDVWPDNCALIDHQRAEELLEKATKEADDDSKLKKKEGEGKTETSEGEKKSGEKKTSFSWGKKKEKEVDPDMISKGLEHATFEVLKDGSQALLIKPGFRLKLNVNDLLDGGDANKEERKLKQEKSKKKKGKWGKFQGIGSDSNAVAGPEDPWANMREEKDFETNWGGKNFINEYTITMDIKLLDPIPREGLSLFQTALIHTEENKKAGKVTLSRSDGEAIVNQAGGVGMFGTFGDTTKARMEPGHWQRVVVTVQCGDGTANNKGLMKTWVGTEAGVVLKEESIVADQRFAINPDHLFLFSSAQAAMMPGNIAIRTMRIEACVASDTNVRANRARDKVLSMYEEDRKKEADQQRKGLSLAPLFPKPRPMWSAPALIGLFGDSFIEKTAFEASSYLAWSFTVLNFALQKIGKGPQTNCSSRILQALSHSSGFDHDTRVQLSDVLHVFQQSALIFKLMMRLLKTPTETQLLSFLKKIKKLLTGLNVKESLLFPLMVEGHEMLLLVERTTERLFKFVVIQTDPHLGLRNHAVSASSVPSSPEIRFRTCMVLKDIPKKNALDDVFWLAAYNLTIHTHEGDTNAFYDVLLPFLTGKPLEVSLVEAESLASTSSVHECDSSSESKDSSAISDLLQSFCGEWRSPQRSVTAYVRCVEEALIFLLKCKGATDLQAQLVYLFLQIEMVQMIKNDLSFMHPDENGSRVCDIAIKELCRTSVKLTDQISQSDLASLYRPDLILQEIYCLVEDARSSLQYCMSESTQPPPLLDLTGPSTDPVSPTDPALVQAHSHLIWDVQNSPPDPGQATSLRKYLPVDMLQIPTKVVTRNDAVLAIRLCDRLATLLDNQTHCVKNDRMLILALIQHVFTQVVPVPKPRGFRLREKELKRSERLARRAKKREEDEKTKESEKKRRQDEKKQKEEEEGTTQSTAASRRRERERQKAQEKAAKEKAEKEKETVKAPVSFIGEEIQQDFEAGKLSEQELTSQQCIWDQEITYELQVELLLTLQRISEHLMSSLFSLHQDRSLDGVGLVVQGAIVAISDAIIRQRACDTPSEASCMLTGRSVSGKQLGLPGFGITTGTFATQSETIEIHSPELAVVRTAILDYFQSPEYMTYLKIYSWEEQYDLKPSKNLIKYLRMVSRDSGLSLPRPHVQLLDSKPMNSHLMKNYPEMRCYRDLVFWWKYILNPDRKIFPNYSDPQNPHDISRLERMTCQLDFNWDEQAQAYSVNSFDGSQLRCRPDPKQTNPLTGKPIPPEMLPSHRFPSTATPSFYLPAPTIKTEDDVIYRPNLPSFEDQFGPVLNQRDSELLISYLTVPYMRLPLILTFFSTEDRIHKLQSKELRLILDSVLFEPGKCLPMNMVGVEPMMVPTQYPDLLSTPYGLLFNELYRSPTTIIRSILSLLRGALAVDTGSVVDDEGKTFNPSTIIILYVVRLTSRALNFITFLLEWSVGKHESFSSPLREVDVTAEIWRELEEGRQQIISILFGQFNPLCEDYLKKLDHETSSDPTNEKLIDRNSRLACDLHAHKIVMFRNVTEHEFSTLIAKSILGSFVYLTTRHTWNKTTKEGTRLQVPETELYELLQTQRRRLIGYLSTLRQGELDQILQTSLQVSSSLTGSFRASADVLDNQNRWSRIQGERSAGRWAVGSTRTTEGETSNESKSKSADSDSDDELPVPTLARQRSFDSHVGEVADTAMLGVEIDVGLGQMTLRSKHLAALIPDIANHMDVKMIFGDATMQASLIERAENRQIYRLVGLNHELEYWQTAHNVCPPLGDEWEREYDPAELFPSEQWIVNIFEPVRKSFFDGPQPPPMQFMMPEKPLSPDAEVAVLLGLHQSLGGPWKLVYLFRRLKCLHVYECLSQGREWWFSLHMTTDVRFTLKDMMPSIQPREHQYPHWWINGSGKPYPAGVRSSLMNELDGISATGFLSVSIVRDPQHHLNLSGGRERLVPARLLSGAIPDALLDTFHFWQDESQAPIGTTVDQFPVLSRGYKRLRGYPKIVDENTEEFIIFVEIHSVGSWEAFNSNLTHTSTSNNVHLLQATGYPGRSMNIIRRPKRLVEQEFKSRQTIASLLESLQLLKPPSNIKSKRSEKTKEEIDEESKFKMDAAVECDYEGKGEFWPCVVRRVNDNGSYDLEFVGDYKWMGIQRAVEADIIQKRGEGERRKRGEGVWHWDGMSESEDEDFRSDSEDEKEDMDSESGTKSNKDRITFFQFDDLWKLMAVARGDLDLCLSTLRLMGSVPGVQPFTDVDKLAVAMSYYLTQPSLASSEESSSISSTSLSQVLPADYTPAHQKEDLILLNLLYSPRRSRLFSMAKVLTRIENLSYICAWTKSSNASVSTSSIQLGSLPFSCPSIDLVELPRLKLAFTARLDHEGDYKLYSVDHTDLYISNERNSQTSKMLAGIPHSLLLTNVRGESQVLVPVVPPVRPIIGSEPFSTYIVLNRKMMPMNERYFLYPVHVSLSFLLTKGLNSAVYLMLLRFLHRNYEDVFRLSDSIATDTAFNAEGQTIFQSFASTNDDWHPDAHACRLKISLVTMDSGTQSPWDLTIHASKHSLKLDCVSSSCRLQPEEELQLLESGKIATCVDDDCYDPKKHDDYSMAVNFNRRSQLRSVMQILNDQKSSPDHQIECVVPPRTLLSNWPYYQDNSIFGETYNSLTEITSINGTENSWSTEILGGDEVDAPPGGWFVFVAVHTLWSSSSVKLLPLVTDLVPTYQNMASFLSVRADCVGVSDIAKRLKVKVFPTFIMFRQGKEIDRIEGGDRAIEKIVRALGSHLKDSDKIAHAKRRQRLRIEKALSEGKDPDQLDEEEVEEQGPIEWTWDLEQCGSSMAVDLGGLRVAMKEETEEADQTTWEWSHTQRWDDWTAFDPIDQKQLEKAYRSGKIYRDGGVSTSTVYLWNNNIKISTFEVTGFYADWHDGERSASVRRKGDRLSVPHEQDYLSEEQKERDRKNEEWNEQVKAYQKQMKQELYGKDIEAIRGTIGMSPNTGIHQWTVRWSHEPSRGGGGDAIGVCSELAEYFGAGSSPILGGNSEGGISLGLHANGDLFHAGTKIHSFQKRDRKHLGTSSLPASKPAEPAPANECTTASVESKEPEAAEKPESKQTTLLSSLKKPLCSLFGRFSLVSCQFDTSNGGTLSFLIDDEPLDYSISNVFSLLGGATEVFPAVSMAPLDELTEEEVKFMKEFLKKKKDSQKKKSGTQEEGEAQTEGEETRDEEDNEEPPPDDPSDEDEESKDSSDEEDSEFNPEHPSLILFTTELRERFERMKEEKEAQLKKDEVSNDPPAVSESSTSPEPPSEASSESSQPSPEGLPPSIDQQSLEPVPPSPPQQDSTQASEESKTDSPAPSDQPEEAEAPKPVDESSFPIERVRWMHETEQGWELYSPEISRELEEVLRAEKSDHVLNLSGKTYKINVTTKKQVDDDGSEHRLRRHLMGEGMSGKWEILTMKYEKPFGLYGQGIATILEKIWSQREQLDGKKCGLGFLFLYSLLSGDSKCKVISGYSSSFSNDSFSGPFMFGGKTGFSTTKSSSSSDSHRLATLFAQLYVDKQNKSLPASVVNVLCRNRQVALRVPRFKDTRKTSHVPFFNGWKDDTEPRSPLADLFSNLAPIMMSMKRKGTFHFPPSPPYPELAPPAKTFQMSISSKSVWEIPKLTDYGCEQRFLSPISQETIQKLATSVNYRLGSDVLRPEPPIHIHDESEFKKIVTQFPNQLFIVDFHAVWCGPCKTLEPVFRYLSLSTPTAKFLKIDVDECETLAAQFNVSSMPTIHFMRSLPDSSTSLQVLGTINGAGPQFLVDFAKYIETLSTPEELSLLEKFHSKEPGENIQSVLENISSDDRQLDILASEPLKPVTTFLGTYLRSELQLPALNPILPFSVSNHEAANSAVAASILTRIKEDIAAYAESANESPIPKISAMLDSHLEAFFYSQSPTASSSENQLSAEHSEDQLRAALCSVQSLLTQLRLLRDSDENMVKDAVPLIEKFVNHVDLSPQDPSLMTEKIRYLLNNISGQNSGVWVEFLYGVLLSTRGEQDLLRLNPYIPKEHIRDIFALVSVIMLRANRLGHTNRCIGLTIGLESMLKKALKLEVPKRASAAATLKPQLIQIGEELSKTISFPRCYIRKSESAHQQLTFDPRYLVFEFVWNIQLRKKQVEIVDDFRSNLARGTSKVKQMIMGAGKTSVVAPLLALILADGQSLVLSVVPKALVEMSRTRMRETFAAIMVKRIYTLDFDRSTTVKPSMRRSLENAAKNRGVVVATPTTIKSVMLSYVEILQQIKEARSMGLKSKIPQLQSQCQELAKILSIFKEGVMLLDEVDLILHPLKSELNFPIGEKFDLDGSEDGERWSLPIHLLDAIFFSQTNKTSTMESRGVALDVLQRLKSVLEEGVRSKQLQRLPHLTLLDPDFYHERVKPLMAEWTYLWLQKQHLHGIDHSEAIRYMLEGVAAKSISSTKLKIIEKEIDRLSLSQEFDPAPSSPQSSSFAEPSLEVRLRYLKDAREVAAKSSIIMEEIYTLDSETEEKLKGRKQLLGALTDQVVTLRKKIGELECPRDDSLDNSIVVWVSEAFNSIGGAQGKESGGSESSVPALCTLLEDKGLTVRRCADYEEAISRVRDLQSEGQLRCLVIGGDEDGAGCGPTCIREHNGRCLKCKESFYHHNGHECRTGGRGSFLLDTSDKESTQKKKQVPLELVKLLTDTESSTVSQCPALPATRIALYSQSMKLKEEERLEFWSLGSTVTDEGKMLISWVSDLPTWEEEASRLSLPESDILDFSSPELDDQEEGVEEEKGAELIGSTPRLRTQITELKVQLDRLEDEKVSIFESDESLRKSFSSQSEEKFQQLLSILSERIQHLSAQIRSLDSLQSPLFDTTSNLFKENTSSCYPCAVSGKDCALSLAFFEVNASLLIPSLSVDSLTSTQIKQIQRHYSTLTCEISLLQQMTLAAKVIAYVSSPLHKKLLNLSYNWLSTFLPHCLAKVNRVSFGLLSSEDCKAALEADPHVPRSRLKLAVPFIGKDVPSKSSEFAHPDVIIGLTVLAYRYSGLRKEDYNDIIDDLTSQFAHEIGPARDRDSSRLHEDWVHKSGGIIRGLKATYDGKTWTPLLSDADSTSASDQEVVQLKFLQKSNLEQMSKLFKLWSIEPLVIHHYLTHSIFPQHMRSQRMKISASGQSVGGDMLVGKRVGFSGTPSDLLPAELGRCDYETGDDGMMLTTVLDRKVTSFEYMDDDWSVEKLLERIATSTSPLFHALIDTGALVTGYSNQQVARQLLDRGLAWCEGVVFLDDNDRQQVLVRATGRVVSADQCGVPLDKRFAFYDQIHTTGMDIKHVVNACAAITLGKDMVFRDYVQGAYRMRGIGAGQQIRVFVIPEVRRLMDRELKNAEIPVKELALSKTASPDYVLEEVVAWLIINSLRSEQTQWAMLCIQNIGNLYRKNAFNFIHSNTSLYLDDKPSTTTAISESTSPSAALAIFDESIDFSLESGVPDPIPFEARLQSFLDQNTAFLSPADLELGESILSVVREYSMIEGSANRLDTEQEREQEQEQEKEVQAKKDQQIEVEKFVDREYSRQEEVQRPWAFSLLSRLPPKASQLDPKNMDHPFYPLSEFKLRHQEPLSFPSSLYVSSNYFNPNWTGLRRLKNVVMIMEYAPDASPSSLTLKDPELPRVQLTDDQEKALQKAHTLLGFHSAQEGRPHSLNRSDLINAIQAITDEDLEPSDSQLDWLMQKFSESSSLSFDEFKRLLLSRYLFPEHDGRFFVALSLSEAETIRRILHVRQSTHTWNEKKLRLEKERFVTASTVNDCWLTNTQFSSPSTSLLNQVSSPLSLPSSLSLSTPLIDGFSTEVALHYSPISNSGTLHVSEQKESSQESPSTRKVDQKRRLTRQGVIFDSSTGWSLIQPGSKAGAGSVGYVGGRLKIGFESGSISHNITGSTLYESSLAHSCFRFFDCDMFYPDSILNLLVREVQGSPREKERFFHSVVGARRRLERKWQETPLSRLFLLAHEFISLKHRAQAVYFREAIKKKGWSPWEAFTAFDADNSGVLSASEFFGALRFLEIPDLTPEDVADFIDALDTDRDGFVDYREYMDGLGEEATEEVETNSESSEEEKQGPTSLTKVEPYGAEIMREVLLKRRQQEVLLQKEDRLKLQQYRDALDVKLFEEELKTSQLREGGANPLLSTCDSTLITISQDSATDLQTPFTVTDFKFSTNQTPLRFNAIGKHSFIPIFLGTAANRPIPPNSCKSCKKSKFSPCNYSWMHCSTCRKRGTDYLCFNCWNNYICAGCYVGDRKVIELERSDPSKNPTFLRCQPGCSFTVQIPTEGGADPMTGDFSISMELRFDRLPARGKLQSLLRFSLPDMSRISHQHRTSVYLNGDGIILGKPIGAGGGFVPPTAHFSDPESEKEVNGSDSEEKTSEIPELPSEKTPGKKVPSSTPWARIRTSKWTIVTVCVSPLQGEISCYIDGQLSSSLSGLDHADLRLHHKLVVLGGGKQAHIRGGDLRRLVIYGHTLSPEQVTRSFLLLADSNPAIGGRLVRIQSVFRGYRLRKQMKDKKNETKENEEEKSETAENEEKNETAENMQEKSEMTETEERSETTQLEEE